MMRGDLSPLLRAGRLVLLACSAMLLPACGILGQLLPAQSLQPGMVLYPAPQDSFIRMDTDVRDVNFHYRKYEGTGENLVLLHGFSSSTYTWEDMIAELQKLYKASGRPAPRIWALDMKGCGWSDKPVPARYDPLTLTGEVSAWMDRLGIDSATVAGNSFGGAVALLLARDHPEKVSRLVLIDSGGCPVVMHDPADYPNVAFTSFAARMVFSRGLVKKTLQKLFYDPSQVTGARVDAYYNRLRTEGGLKSQLLLARSLFSDAEKYYIDLAAVAQETLILWGREDRLNPLKYACCLKNAIPGARLAIIPRCGHVPQEEKPAETAEIFFKFLNRLPLQSWACVHE